ncbi:TetR/AcrR family transcriptional regulator [Actinocrispum wychmicini]|uniref:TetR/AcrR family transcriptional regulator n=1 Tax=Actinocrispum wychmicini TaxID=1213861 RepID=UPI00104787D4|nr:TetR/AcrR family transcriptional regulator [Actinocrispum wychmicini]
MDTADRLIESTRELLWERGYVGMSPKVIMARADVGQGSMYHHFRGKADLARTAIDRTAAQMRADVSALLDGPGTATERITAYLRRDRDALMGCPIGRLTQDPGVVADPDLRGPVDEMFRWLRENLARVVGEGRDRGEFDETLDPDRTAAMIAAVVQGGYVLAKAANDPEAFDQAVEGAVALLAAQAG